MARGKKFAPGSLIRGEIGQLLRQGYDNNAAWEEIKRRHPTYNANLLRQEVALKAKNLKSVDVLNQFNKRTMVDISSIAGCGPGQRARIRVNVTYTDPETGLVKEFGHQMDLTGTHRWETHLNRLVDGVRRQAARKGYRIPNRQELEQDSNYTATITSVSCV